MSDQRKDEPHVDPADFIGEAPAGDAFLDDFVSNDQSAVAERASHGASDESEDAS